MTIRIFSQTSFDGFLGAKGASDATKGVHLVRNHQIVEISQATCLEFGTVVTCSEVKA
ncbi:MAG: hypothetical protein ACIWVG_09160 [Gloeotrichia echinulata HAB0833]